MPAQAWGRGGSHAGIELEPDNGPPGPASPCRTDGGNLRADESGPDRDESRPPSSGRQNLMPICPWIESDAFELSRPGKKRTFASAPTYQRPRPTRPVTPGSREREGLFGPVAPALGGPGAVAPPRQ